MYGYISPTLHILDSSNPVFFPTVPAFFSFIISNWFHTFITCFSSSLGSGRWVRAWWGCWKGKGGDGEGRGARGSALGWWARALSWAGSKGQGPKLGFGCMWSVKRTPSDKAHRAGSKAGKQEQARICSQAKTDTSAWSMGRELWYRNHTEELLCEKWVNWLYAFRGECST